MTDIVGRLDGTQPMTGSLEEMLQEAKAEIERLRHDNMRLKTANDCAYDPRDGELSKLNREIERLRADWKPDRGSLVEYRLLAEAQADNERLRSALKPLAEWAIDATAKPTLADCDRARRALENKPMTDEGAP